MSTSLFPDLVKPPLEIAGRASLSPCERYRYTLFRDWEDGPKLTFIMLNPSTADAMLDDRTIGRCIRFAQDHGFTGLRVGNVFAFRATDPADMKAALDPVGPGNDDALREMFVQARDAETPIVAAWGVHGAHLGRADQVVALAASVGVGLHCLGTSKEGHPRHPLYIRADQPFARFPCAS